MQTSARAKVLVVNDDTASLLALTSLLDAWTEELGYELVGVSSGYEALRQVLMHDFAVILLDVNMPGMSGFETADAIRQHPRSADVPIIFITAYQADEIDRLKAYQQGAADFLFTPVIPQILRAKVSVFITLRRKNEELQQQAAMLSLRTHALMETNEHLQREIAERQAAERANHAKDEFLAMLGHELRNPLSAIGSAASLLGMPAITAELKRRAQGIIDRQTRQLSSIVDDLLDLTRAMSGKIVLARRPLDLAEVVATCIETFMAAGRLEAHRLTRDLAPCWVDGDPTRLEQIASNLIDNAIKYTPPGGKIHVAVTSERGEGALTVSDNGIGIGADLLPTIFDLFVQEPSSLDRARGGLGIGLSLVRRLADLHGGTVDVRSAGPGLGSTFTVRLHRVQPVETGLPQRKVGLPQRRGTVLVVDDNDDGREMLAMALDAHGNLVYQAAGGASGIDIANSCRPDVAIVDIGLPDIDGYEVARRLRQSPATRGVRLVALTGYGLAKDQARAMEAGFDIHLVKPVDIDKLVSLLGEFCP
ncbi:response regulator [Massilia sp. TW-1]|uniref:histidine kinase n=1 Tax=Telluria antibiotica TaxID=2717319 RepID=A0ABX0PIP0_9BURK|nr:response regulator [Telluria antibiotica]